ncbi:MAG TPA: pitrilysin family protein [Myxococcota bacterium]|jgi:zinc protease|nr:pitrilysin family protein [Myxococcota bacterium]
MARIQGLRNGGAWRAGGALGLGVMAAVLMVAGARDGRADDVKKGDAKKKVMAAEPLADAAPAAPAPPVRPRVSVPFKTFTLASNGLRLVISEDHSTPNVAVMLYYDVGSRNEEKGRSGFAHLFEHMMFRGSANVAPWEHSVLINKNGGQLNATTWFDRTMYWDVLPAHQLELGLWLEADRMASLAVTDKNFKDERKAVKEERLTSYDNRPYMLSYLALEELAFVNWPYAHSTIGEMKDLDAATIDDVRAFFERYYKPNNCVMAIVGDVDTDAARALVEKHFGDIPKGPPPPPVHIIEPPQTKEKYKLMTDKFAELPAFFEAYHIPPAHTPDSYAMDVLATILTDGESARLYKLLVRDKEIATDVSAYMYGRRGPDLFYIEATLKDTVKPADARALVHEELDRIVKDGVTDKELEKAKNIITDDFVGGLERNYSKAQKLAEDWLYWGDPALVNTELDEYLSVTRERIQEAAKKYLLSINRTAVDVLPEGGKP